MLTSVQIQTQWLPVCYPYKGDSQIAYTYGSSVSSSPAAESPACHTHTHSIPVTQTFRLHRKTLSKITTFLPFSEAYASRNTINSIFTSLLYTPCDHPNFLGDSLIWLSAEYPLTLETSRYILPSLILNDTYFTNIILTSFWSFRRFHNFHFLKTLS